MMESRNHTLSPFDPAHQTFLRGLSEGSLKTNEEMRKHLLDLDISDESSTYLASQCICELLTKQSYIFPINFLGPSYWRKDFLEKQHSNGMMLMVATFPGEVEKIIFNLYEENFGSTRETILYLDDQREPHNIPYLSVLVKNALNSLPGIPSKGMIHEKIAALFGPEKNLKNWCEEKKRSGMSLKQFAGQTNTNLGRYEQIFQEIPSLKTRLLENSDLNIDLGGGFATPEISQATGMNFTSYDIVPPQKALEWNLDLSYFASPSGDEKIARHQSQLANQSFQYFDVFQNDFPDQMKSYNICSFGFLNSSVRSLSEAQPDCEQELKKFNTMFFAVWRVLRLVAKNKDVVLLTYGRPHFKYMNKLVLLRFSKNRVQEIVIPKHKVAFEAFATSSSGHGLSRKQMQALLRS